MTKFFIANANITCALQQDSEITNEKCLTGILSRNNNGLLFEEAIRKGRAPRNPKLFDGKYISMVRKQNGRYQFHIKTFNPKEMDRKETAFAIYCELTQAFNIIEN